jgi:hypothetical protein
MTDTSQRKTRFQNRGNNTQAERNRLNASIPQGNEINANVQNIIRSEGVAYSNAENFAQTDALYFSTAKDIYNEGELALQSIETKKARMSYTATFASNTYTLTAKSVTISEIIDGTFNNQEYQDKTAYLSPVALFDGFYTSFIAPATNTGSTSIAIQLYDGSFTTKTLKKYNDSGTLVTLFADDILLGRKYDIVIINGDAVLFGGIQQATETISGIGKISTTTQVNVGTDDLTFITPLKLKAYITSITGSLKGTSGYTYLPNGLILNWGVTSTTVGNIATNTVIMNFALPFPTAGIHAISCVTDAQGGCQIGSAIISTTQARVTYANLSGSTKSFTGVTFAIGY